MKHLFYPTKKTIIIVVITVIFTAWLVISTIWFSHFWSYNKYFDDNFKHLHGYTSHIDQTTSILYGVWTPIYLEFGGNLSCNSEDQQITILVWPSLFCKDIKEIGLILKDDDNTHMIYVDNKMNYDINMNSGISPEQDKRVKEIIDNKRHEIFKLWELMKERFNINT